MSFHKATSSHSQMEKMKAYRRLRQCCSFSDVFIYTQDHQSISAHRPVLAAHSPWLARLFDYFDCGCGNASCGQNGRGEVRLMIPGVDMDHLERLMDLLYLGWVQLGSSEEYAHLQTLAQLLGIRRFPPMPRQAFRQTQVEVIDLLEEEDLDEMEEDEEDEELELEPESESSDSPTWDPELAEFSYLIEDFPDHEPTDDNMKEWAKPSSEVSFASEPILDQQDPLSNPEGLQVDQYYTDEPEPDLPESAAVCVYCYQVFREPVDLVAHLSQDHPQSVPEIESMVQNFSSNDVTAPSNLGARSSDSSQTDGQPQSFPSQIDPITKMASDSRLGDFLQPPKVNSSPLPSFARIRILPRKQPVLKVTPEKDTNPGQAQKCELQTDLAPNLPSQLEIFRLPQSLPSDQNLDTSAEELKRIMSFSPKFRPKAEGDVFKGQIVEASHKCVSSSQNILHQPEPMESSPMMPSDPPTEATSQLGTHTTSNAEPNSHVDRDAINEPENVQQMKLGLSGNPNLQQLKSVMTASPKIRELSEQDEVHEVAECAALAKEPTSLELNEPVQNQTSEITQQLEPQATSKPASQCEKVGQWVEFRQDQETAQLVPQESEILQSQQTCQFNQQLKPEMTSDMVDAGVHETVDTETVQISPRQSDDSPSQLKPIERVSAPPDIHSTRRDEPEPDPEIGFGLQPQPDVDDELTKREEALQGFVLAQNPLQNLESRKSDHTKSVESEVSMTPEMDGNLSRKSQVQVQFVDEAQHQISDYPEHLTNVQIFQSTKECEVPEQSAPEMGSVPQPQLDRDVVDLTQHVTPQPSQATRSLTFTSSSQERNPTLDTGTQPCKSNVRPALLDTFVESPEQILATNPNRATPSRSRSERDEAHETLGSGTAQYVISSQHVIEQSESSGTIACEQFNPIQQSETERSPSPKSRAAPNEEQVEQPELIKTESGTRNSKPKKTRAKRPTKTCPKPLKPKPAPRPRPKPGKRGKSKVEQPEDESPYLGQKLPSVKKQGPKKHPAKGGKNKRATKCVTSEGPAPNSLSEGDFEATIAQETRNLAQMAETNNTSSVLDALEHEMEGNLQACPGTVDISDSVSQEPCLPITTKKESSANLEIATTLPNKKLNKSKGLRGTSPPSATPSLPWVLRPKRKKQTSPLLEPKPKRIRGPQKQKKVGLE
ncbi:hypothetical protein TCAL_14533 [Tigriopus californicus]|uniref:BTB domain-containing protein n=2 Tax=Tigriopus californicus TaxID=6832 RepID=A0A553PT74_TIGCA|nr:hypothetical protein TCAL_14533 [Tigriopus californicus]